ncbi:MAG: bifunctional 4-hydroxy-2-oxoglutarate aldolase/2-dehydro-3-deoxy-phosphogluconate aldolase [Verrucomicrobiae bacterium]|nr:bifunctional 4-hydroxy-2-oxoglutarate aldolase/2-dehydro-3-deoxy-phosphogluconate aldolase [Verrucomicrobiae bacterium]
MESLRSSVHRRITDAGLVAVIRAPDSSVVPDLAAALAAGGISIVEITTSTPGFAGAIRRTRDHLGDQVLVGAGTLLSREDCMTALGAGASFLICPVLRPTLVPLAHAAGCPIALGAGTATEAQLGHEAGADFVKLFPAESLGPGFIRSLLAPLPHLQLMPTGGIGVANVAAYRAAGCVAVGVGGSLLAADKIRARDWKGISRAAASLVVAWQSAGNPACTGERAP